MYRRLAAQTFRAKSAPSSGWKAIRTKDDINPAKAAWTNGVYPLINQLEANGISWAWVNDASVQEATLTKDGRINIRGNQFQALILANDSIIGLQTAEKINDLAQKGMRLLATGVLPTKQPSYLNWQQNDTITAHSIADALKAKNSRYIQNKSEFTDWINRFAQPVRFGGHHGFTRKAEREMPDGSRIQFIWNKSDQWQTLAVTLDKNYVGSYWLNPETGAVINTNEATSTYRMAPYGSVLLYASTKKTVPERVVSLLPILADNATELAQLTTWTLQADSLRWPGLTEKDTPLFNWKTKEAFRFSSAVGVYTLAFNLIAKKSTAHYFLDLGAVYFTTEVTINGKAASKRIYAPYQLNITPFVQAGTNQIEVRVTPTQLNGFIGRAGQGDKRYSQFKNKTDQLMSAGLAGPVRILEK